jgi:hypothetical protein
MDRLSDEAPIIEALRREVTGLLALLNKERRKTIAIEARVNGLSIDNRRLLMQHEQDQRDIAFLRAQYARVSTRNTMVEGALNSAHQRLTPHGGFVAITENDPTSPCNDIPERR